MLADQQRLTFIYVDNQYHAEDLPRRMEDVKDSRESLLSVQLIDDDDDDDDEGYSNTLAHLSDVSTWIVQ